MKILVIDDSEVEHAVIQSYLEEFPYTLLFAKDGYQGIDMYNKEQPDLVLLDVMMSGIDGYGVARRIRSSSQSWVPIIFLSGNAAPEDLVIGIEAGGDDYLTKPINKQILNAKVNAMARIAQMRHQLVAISADLQQANKNLERLAVLDGLTGIANRRRFDEMLELNFAIACRTQSPITLLMCDIDQFKRYNDHYGHIQGDECLKSVAETIADQPQRTTDLAARYGGEEFAVILPSTDLPGAIYVAQRLCQSIRDLAMPHEGIDSQAQVTLSIGVAAIIPTRAQTTRELIKQADQHLYYAKEQGRDRWVADTKPSIAFNAQRR